MRYCIGVGVVRVLPLAFRRDCIALSLAFRRDPPFTGAVGLVGRGQWAAPKLQPLLLRTFEKSNCRLGLIADPLGDRSVLSWLGLALPSEDVEGCTTCRRKSAPELIALVLRTFGERNCHFGLIADLAGNNEVLSWLGWATLSEDVEACEEAALAPRRDLTPVVRDPPLEEVLI